MADDETALYAMLREIQQNGEVSMEDLPNDPLNKTTMNTIYLYSIGAGIVTNLVEETGYVLPTTLKSRDVNDKAIKR